MAELDKDTIANLSQLSRIHCTEEEQMQLLEDLKKILHYVEKLQALDTEDTPPCNHVLAEHLGNVMREDEVAVTLQRETFLANAPDQIGGMIRVPPVMRAP